MPSVLQTKAGFVVAIVVFKDEAEFQELQARHVAVAVAVDVDVTAEDDCFNVLFKIINQGPPKVRLQTKLQRLQTSTWLFLNFKFSK